MFDYDEEMPAGFSDADLEQAEYERMGKRLAALRAAGVCAHGWTQGYTPEAAARHTGLQVGGIACLEDGCGMVWASEDEWYEARQEALI
jgi:hypothetical protein